MSETMTPEQFVQATRRAWTEYQFQVELIREAQLHGWHHVHFRKSRNAHGWHTAVAGDGRGFPDLILLRGPEIIYVELKSEKGKLSISQENWRDWLLGAGQRWYCWKPSDWDEVVEVLSCGGGAISARPGV